VTPHLVFRPEAEAELLEARAWYELQRIDLDRVFAEAVEATVAAITRNPLAYRRVKGETRRALVHRFPYAVYFQARADEIVVLAVMHGRRWPQQWQSRR